MRYFSQDEAPLSVVPLFDLTGSVRGVQKKLAAGATAVLAHFKPEDKVAVVVHAAAHLPDRWLHHGPRPDGGRYRGSGCNHVA